MWRTIPSWAGAVEDQEIYLFAGLIAILHKDIFSDRTSRFFREIFLSDSESLLQLALGPIATLLRPGSLIG